MQGRAISSNGNIDAMRIQGGPVFNAHRFGGGRCNVMQIGGKRQATKKPDIAVGLFETYMVHYHTCIIPWLYLRARRAEMT